MNEIYLRNRQRARPVNLKLLKAIAATLIPKTGAREFRVGVLLVGPKEMTRLNEAFLQHAGTTDVIAFGYATESKCPLQGEIFICVDEAVRQARRFRTRWQKELIRYLAHGLLHFQGYSDATPGERRAMKKVEDALVKEMDEQFPLSELGSLPTRARVSRG